MKNFSQSKTGKIRIISGKWRGRKLSVIRNVELRPTTNRMRETLFNWLRPIIINARCLDCFSGSGLLGLEALSNYASSVTFLEKKLSAIQQIQRNIFLLKATNIQIIWTNTLTFLKKPGTSYDVVFVDPPFYKEFLPKTLTMLEQNYWLTNDAYIYVESETKNSLAFPINWKLHREKITKTVSYRLFHRIK